ncbi:MAG: diguanylate cyclase [Pseudomonadota bacterium]
MKAVKEFERTVVFADGAVSHIKRNKVPAYPQTYEVWYSYESGINKELSAAVDDIFEKYGRVSPVQVQHLYNTYLSNNPLGDKIEQMGTEISNEVDDVISIVSKGGELAKGFDVSLKQALDDLHENLNQTELQKIIKRMSLETGAVVQKNELLEEQLKGAHAKMLELQKRIDEVREETIMDQLTMIGNRKHFDRSLERAIAQHKHADQPMSLILADIDRFKSFNDNWGHQTGDQVLRLVAHAIKSNVKTNDIPCRYGGEEFAVILPETTLEQALNVGERIRKAVAKRDVVKRSTGENLGKITISAGVATLRPEDTEASLVRRADECLYAGKNAGRNRVISENLMPTREVA